MSQASSSSGARRSGTSAARVRAPLALAPPTQPLAVTPAPVFEEDLVFDDETGLPLIVCPFCKDVRLIADTTRYSTKNLGKRYFKCPRSIPGEQYEAYLKKRGYLGSNSLLEAELLQEIQDVKLKLHEVKEQVADMRTGAGRTPRISCFCAVLTSVNLFFLLLAILLVGMK
ncbi:unnamed protein product [Urochloa decumbens]|uniref:Zinc finger GRF-type domain-containing protein n=1 Tax=Urochloa decumbens TaxID=240449 RepID=A0ABC8ZNZ2_9POAL